MIRLWDFKNGDRIRLTDIDGDVFICFVIDISDAEERTELDKQEHGITVCTEDGRYIEFYQSEIKSIELLKPKNAKVVTGDRTKPRRGSALRHAPAN